MHQATTAELLVVRTLVVKTKHVWGRAAVHWAWRLWQKQMLGEFCLRQERDTVENEHSEERRQLVVRKLHILP